MSLTSIKDIKNLSHIRYNCECAHFVIFQLLEKGKLKHALVSPQPGETKGIKSYKVCGFSVIYLFFSYDISKVYNTGVSICIG